MGCSKRGAASVVTPLPDFADLEYQAKLAQPQLPGSVLLVTS